MLLYNFCHFWNQNGRHSSHFVWWDFLCAFDLHWKMLIRFSSNMVCVLLMMKARCLTIFVWRNFLCALSLHWKMLIRFHSNLLCALLMVKARHLTIFVDVGFKMAAVTTIYFEIYCVRLLWKLYIHIQYSVWFKFDVHVWYDEDMMPIDFRCCGRRYTPCMIYLRKWSADIIKI